MLAISEADIETVEKLCGEDAKEILSQARQIAYDLGKKYISVRVVCKVIPSEGVEGRSLHHTFVSLGFHQVSSSTAMVVISLVTGCKESKQ